MAVSEQWGSGREKGRMVGGEGAAGRDWFERLGTMLEGQREDLN